MLIKLVPVQLSHTGSSVAMHLTKIVIVFVFLFFFTVVIARKKFKNSGKVQFCPTLTYSIFIMLEFKYYKLFFKF